MLLDRVCKREGCQKGFTTSDKRQQYCCISCAYQDRPSNKIEVTCDCCGKYINIFPSRLEKKHHFCGKTCQNEWQKHYHAGKNNPAWTGKRSLEKRCGYCGVSFYSKTNTAKYCSNKCRLEALFKKQQRENHPSWKGGVTEGRRKLELESHYKAWRQTVYKRDKYCCSVCGASGNICAHHIKTFADYPELRADVSNGITLCQKHHLMTYHKEPLYEDYFYRILSLLSDVSRKSVRIAAVFYNA